MTCFLTGHGYFTHEFTAAVITYGRPTQIKSSKNSSTDKADKGNTLQAPSFMEERGVGDIFWGKLFFLRLYLWVDSHAPVDSSFLNVIFKKLCFLILKTQCDW